MADIDYRSLLLRYMRFAAECEGFMHIPSGDAIDEYNKDAYEFRFFSDDERMLLIQLEKEADAKDIAEFSPLYSPSRLSTYIDVDAIGTNGCKVTTEILRRG